MGFFERLAPVLRPGKRLADPRWGVHPDDRKRPAADAPLRCMPMPARLHVPLAQHLGAPARPCVLVGEHVLKGQLIGEAQGAISAPVHAPTSGTVSAIGEIVAPHPSGLPVLAVSIDADGEDRWIDSPACEDPLALPPDEIGRRVAAAGVVGLGGAAFPAAVKLTAAARAAVTTLLINGGECEPYLSCDDRLMRDRAPAIIDGIRIMAHAAGVERVVVGIEDDKPEALAAMQAAAAAHAALVTIAAIPARYPMGSEKQLVLTLTGAEVPAGGRPSDVGVLVHNVGTMLAVRDAIRFGRPLISRTITLNGACFARPGNVEVPIGALCSDVVAFAGGLREAPARLVMGGPMMGLQLPTLEVPVIKGSSGILALAAAELPQRAPSACIRCGNCLAACPVGLLPMEMHARIGAGRFDAAAELGLRDCLACGCCAYVCPAALPLVQAFHHAKGELARRERDRQRSDTARRLTLARSERLTRESREKAEAAARRAAERRAQKAREAAADPAADPASHTSEGATA